MERRGEGREERGGMEWRAVDGRGDEKKQVEKERGDRGEEGERGDG